MKLTATLLRLSNHLPFKHIPGNIQNGKHRVWPSLGPKYKRHLMNRIDTEIGNMKLLSRPYLSVEESRLAHETVQMEEEAKRFAEAKEATRANKNKMRDQYMSAHLDHLRNHRTWE